MTGKYGGTPDPDIQVLVSQRELDQLYRFRQALLDAYGESKIETDDLEDWGLTDQDIEDL